MSKFLKVIIFLFMAHISFAQAQVSCEVTSTKRDIDTTAKDGWAGPAYSHSCEIDGRPLKFNGEGRAELSLDLTNSRIDITCDSSMNAFVQIQQPLITVAVTDKAGAILEVQTDFIASIKKENFIAGAMPDNEKSFEFLEVRCELSR